MREVVDCRGKLARPPRRRGAGKVRRAALLAAGPAIGLAGGSMAYGSVVAGVSATTYVCNTDNPAASYSPAAQAQNLTTLGSTDWAIFGTTASTAPTAEKEVGGAIVGDFTNVISSAGGVNGATTIQSGPTVSPQYSFSGDGYERVPNTYGNSAGPGESFTAYTDIAGGFTNPGAYLAFNVSIASGTTSATINVFSGQSNGYNGLINGDTFTGTSTVNLVYAGSTISTGSALEDGTVTTASNTSSDIIHGLQDTIFTLTFSGADVNTNHVFTINDVVSYVGTSNTTLNIGLGYATLSEVPEPSSLSLLTLSSAFLLQRRRRREQNNGLFRHRIW